MNTDDLKRLAKPATYRPTFDNIRLERQLAELGGYATLTDSAGIPTNVPVRNKRKPRLEAPSTPNLREHWATKAKRTKKQRAAGNRLCAEELQRATSALAVTVIVLTRVAPRFLDSDNLAAAMKSYRDGVADRLRIDDATPLVRWEYAQRKGQQTVELHWYKE